MIVFSSYLPYFNELPITAAANQTLFWSGTYAIMAVVSENQGGTVVVSSANTPSAMIINNIPPPAGTYLTWCGKPNSLDGKIQAG